ncbi:cytochrome P450 2C31 [Xylariomycetidae sp. FL0641]|nr:cytochrome P450 2C31 [Xylariomycetidae sp. FL0641]
MTMGWNYLVAPMGLSGIMLVACAALVISLLPPHQRGFLNGKKYLMPPGPRGRPIMGNLGAWFEARRVGTAQWVRTQGLAQRQDEFGEMTTLSMGTRTWVLLNSTRAVNELIAKRTSYTHERPHLPIAGELVSKNMRPFLKRAADWKEGRLLLHRAVMGGTVFQDHRRVIEDVSLGLLRAYLTENSKTYDRCHYRYGNAVIYSILTNVPLRESQKNLDNLQALTRGFIGCIYATYVDFFPQVTKLPKFLQFWRPNWEKMGDFHYNTFRDWWVALKPLSESSKPTTPLQIIMSDFSGNEDEKMYLALALISAGSDNPHLAFNTGIVAFCANPAAAVMAQEELDKICGSKELRLPNLDDLPNMPYVCAIVKEVLRWRPVAALLPSRLLTKDLEFEGYHLPAGTEFVINMMAVNSRGHANPKEFLPERWLGEESKELKKSRGDMGVDQNLWHYAFAAGKRSCVGWQVAQKELFTTFARLLYCFDFTPTGPIDPMDASYHTPGAELPVKATVRSTAHEQLILTKAAECTTWPLPGQ